MNSKNHLRPEINQNKLQNIQHKKEHFNPNHDTKNPLPFVKTGTRYKSLHPSDY